VLRSGLGARCGLAGAAVPGVCSEVARAVMTAAAPSPAAASAAVMASILIWRRIMILISLDLFGVVLVGRVRLRVVVIKQGGRCGRGSAVPVRGSCI